MVSLNRIAKPKTKRGKRYLESREPKVVENTKQALFVKGGRTNEIVTTALKELYTIKKPFSHMLQKKNILRPFDDSKPLEYLCTKSDSSLFMFGFSSKKRPNSLIIGRTFDGEVMDMFEMSIENMKLMEDFKEAKITLGTKPCLVFNGEPFEVDPDFVRLKCLLTDYFRGETVENIRLQGIEHVLNFTALDGKIYLRSYKVKYENSGTKVPKISLAEIGPSFDFSIKRTKIGSEDLYKKSKKQPKEIIKKKVKNISKDKLGTTFGRIHMQKQDLSKLQLRKVKAFKRKSDSDKESVAKDKKQKVSE